MNATITAHQLYPPSRTDHMTLADLIAVQRFAWADANPVASTPVYYGMTRAETIATANRTAHDVQVALNKISANLAPAW